MSGGLKRWRDTDHLRRAVETAGGQEAFDAAVTQMRRKAVLAEHVRRTGGEEAVADGKAALLAKKGGRLRG